MFILFNNLNINKKSFYYVEGLFTLIYMFIILNSIYLILKLPQHEKRYISVEVRNNTVDHYIYSNFLCYIKLILFIVIGEDLFCLYKSYRPFF
ncbi:MAG: hypothetical protein K0Q49_2030 [Haloplasmataceae bacterium]|jgi:predicted cation transporter|nr:hypothetical protein [Haloplasmataceae bacterium]